MGLVDDVLAEFRLAWPSARTRSMDAEARQLDRLFGTSGSRLFGDEGDDTYPGDDGIVPTDTIFAPGATVEGSGLQDIVMGDPQAFAFPMSFTWYEILPPGRRYKLAMQNQSGQARMFFRRFRGDNVDPAANLALVAPGLELGPGQLWGDLFPGHVGSIWALTNVIPSTIVWTEWTLRV
jgi:hypothetical protein